MTRDLVMQRGQRRHVDEYSRVGMRLAMMTTSSARTSCSRCRCSGHLVRAGESGDPNETRTRRQRRSDEVIAKPSECHISNAIQLKGDRAPRTATFEVRSVPPGEYEG